MNRFPSVLERISDLTDQQIDGLLGLSKKLKYRDEQRFVFTQGLPLLSTLFLENSTRTKLSFAVAIQKLGGHYLDFPTQSSSLQKGETLEETLHTLACQGVDVCVIRSQDNKILEQFKERPPLKLINGGDGVQQHPTQALLDIFTLNELNLDIAGKTMAIIGDVKHSRVANSLSELFTRLGGKIIFCTPEKWSPQSKNNGEITHSLDEAIAQSDILYSLRVQLERHQNESINLDDYISQYSINQEKLAKHGKKDIAVFHPGPVNIGVELQKDILRSPNYKGYEQVKNSLFLRMAVIASMIQNNDKNIGLPLENDHESQIN